MYTGTGEPRTLDVAKSTVCACWRARRVTSEVGRAAATAASVGQRGAAGLVPGRVGLGLDGGEPLGDRHLAGRHHHPGQRERVGAGVGRAGADGHRGPERARPVRRGRGGSAPAASAAAVRKAVLSVPPRRLAASLVSRNGARTTSRWRFSERSVHSGEWARSTSESWVSTPRTVSMRRRAGRRDGRRVGEQLGHLAGDADRQPPAAEQQVAQRVHGRRRRRWPAGRDRGRVGAAADRGRRARSRGTAATSARRPRRR